MPATLAADGTGSGVDCLPRAARSALRCSTSRRCAAASLRRRCCSATRAAAAVASSAVFERLGARSPLAAAQYYPAAHWLSLMEIPAKSEFPGTGDSGNGISPNVKSQGDWIRSVKSGGKQTFSVTAENNTALPCVMEITPATFVLRVASGNDPVFSTAHCDKWLPEVKKQTLKAGAAVEFKVEWTTFRSAQGCRQAKSLLGAGTYVATAAYQESATKRFAFMLTKP